MHLLGNKDRKLHTDQWNEEDIGIWSPEWGRCKSRYWGTDLIGSRWCWGTAMGSVGKDRSLQRTHTWDCLWWVINEILVWSDSQTWSCKSGLVPDRAGQCMFGRWSSHPFWCSCKLLINCWEYFRSNLKVYKKPGLENLVVITEKRSGLGGDAVTHKARSFKTACQ